MTAKSSWGRRGLIIATAIAVHPHFTGCLTLELANVGEVTIALSPGIRICQLSLHQLTTPSPRPPEQASFAGYWRPVLAPIRLDKWAKVAARGVSLGRGAAISPPASGSRVHRVGEHRDGDRSPRNPHGPRSPWQNAYIERFIGSIRRECLDHVIVCTESGLRRILNAYVDYYLRSRTHLALQKDAPVSRPATRPADGGIVAIPQVGGLDHRYQRRAA